MLWLLFCTIGIVSCNDKDDSSERPNQDDMNDIYIAPSVARGKTTILKENPLRSFLGAGYDIMGEYVSNSAVKGQVIDLKKISEDRISSLTGTAGEGAFFEGKDYRQLLKSIMEKGDFVSPTGKKSDYLFTGTITDSYINLKAYDSSSQYTFLLGLSGNRLVRRTIQTLNLKWDTCLSDLFKEALEYDTPEEVIKQFGTHVMIETYLGSTIRTLYRSIVAEEEGKQSLYAAQAGMEACRNTIIKSSNTPAEELAEKNYDSSIAISFQGGDYTTLPSMMVIPGGLMGEPIDITPWLFSLNEANCALVALTADDLMPIYDVISDPDKKQQIKEAVIEYIVSRQPKVLATSPIFQATDGKRYRYSSSYEKLAQETGESFNSYGVIGSIYKSKEEGRTELYRFSDGETDRLSTVATLEDNSSMKSVEVLGYVCVKWEQGVETLYEVSNGKDFAYTTERKDSYGEKGKWKRTGKEIYSMRSSN